jgi:hypothetical protein
MTTRCQVLDLPDFSPALRPGSGRRRRLIDQLTWPPQLLAMCDLTTPDAESARCRLGYP